MLIFCCYLEPKQRFGASVLRNACMYVYIHSFIHISFCVRVHPDSEDSVVRNSVPCPCEAHNLLMRQTMQFEAVISARRGSDLRPEI